MPATPALEATLAMGSWTPLVEFARESAARVARAARLAGRRRVRSAASRRAGGRRSLAADRHAQRRERPRGGRLRGGHGRVAGAGRGGARAIRRRAAPHGTARRGRRHPRLRRFRASPDGGRADHRRRAAAAGQAAASSPCSSRARTRCVSASIARSCRIARRAPTASGSTSPRGSTGTSTASRRPSVRKRRSGANCPSSSIRSTAELQAGDRVLIMSNGGFGGLHERLLAALRARPA